MFAAMMCFGNKDYVDGTAETPNDEIADWWTISNVPAPKTHIHFGDV